MRLPREESQALRATDRTRLPRTLTRRAAQPVEPGSLDPGVHRAPRTSSSWPGSSTVLAGRAGARWVCVAHRSQPAARARDLLAVSAPSSVGSPS